MNLNVELEATTFIIKTMIPIECFISLYPKHD